MRGKLDYPTSKEYLKTFIENTLLNTYKKESCLTLQLPGVGRDSLLRHIRDHKQKLITELGVDLSRLAFLQINTFDEKALFDQLIDDLKWQGFDLYGKANSIHDLLNILTTELGVRVVLCGWINEEDTNIDFFIRLRNVNSMAIDYSLSASFEMSPEHSKEYLGTLSNYVNQNIWYMPLYNKESIGYVIKTQEDLGFAKLSENEKDKIIELSGGWVPLARHYIRKPEDINKITLETLPTEIINQFSFIWDALAEDTKRQLFELHQSTQKNINIEFNDYILKTGLVKEVSDGLYTLFTPMFDLYLEYLSQKPTENILIEDNEIYIDHKKVSNTLTLVERAVIQELLDNKGKVVDREKLAQVIWKDNWEDAYSDWALDKAISRIRTKLELRSKESLIKTVKGKGFLIDA